MSLNESRGLAVGALAISVLSLAASVAALACSPEREQSSAPVARVIHGSTSAAPAPAQLAPEAKPDQPVLSAVLPERPEPLKNAPPPTADASTGLVVKRFVVTSGVERREPLASGQPLVADGKPVYAFAELANRGGGDQDVSVIFERKGSNQRVGYATLDVPANAARHRTWANTRNIREPGTWDAVLIAAGGIELARTSFEVAAK